MKKAQIISQPFIYMAAIIIAGLILILGAKVVHYIWFEKPKIVNAVCISEITEDLKSVSHDEIRTIDCSIERYSCACFVGENIDNIIKNDYIRDQYLETPGYNLFLGSKYRPESFYPAAKLGEIDVESGFTCYAVRSGFLKFTVKGIGRKPMILEPTDAESPKCKDAGPSP